MTSYELPPDPTAQLIHTITRAFGSLPLGEVLRTAAVPEAHDSGPAPTTEEAGTADQDIPPYHSLFDIEPWQPHNPPKKEATQPTVKTVIDRLSKATIDDTVPDSRIIRIFEAARLVTSVIDYKIDRGGNNTLVALVNKATRVAIAIYQQDPTAPELIDQFLADIKQLEPGLLTMKARQRTDDYITWASMDPAYSKKTVADLRSTCNDGPILFIPLARGGVAVGLDVFLRYREATQRKDSVIYPVRLSRHKSSDEEPQLAPAELEHVRNLAEGRHVAIFDEDSFDTSEYAYHEPNTLGLALAYFSTHIKSDQLFTVANSYELG
jgi:hypothetical protein